ncbi:hydantoin utilization protein A [Bacillus freudenreichii]|nr:hydantoin utilization protein A [Bacillus freudenreichii]
MGFRIGIDVGGTFTDFLLIDEKGETKIYKTLTTPDDPTIGFFNGLTDMAADHQLSLRDFIQRISLIVHGTTVGTNAALTYNGAKTALLTTKGFRDILQMRRGIRPDPYNNKYVQPKPFVPRYLRYTVEERTDYSGNEIIPLNEEELLEVIDELKKQQVESVAISFMHSYANHSHEKRTGELIRENLPDLYVTISSELVPRARLYDRTSTTVLNSFIGPIIKKYFEKLISQLTEKEYAGTLLIMQSNGGVATPTEIIQKAANTLLSGPASAPIAANWYLSPHHLKDAITMDMGGTSFDVSIMKDSVPLIRTEGEIANWPINLPTVDIHTIGSGGGSIAWVDDGGLIHVGPQSAGASPGPACYGFGGENPTVTDANLVLGYLNPDYFLGGKMKLDKDAAYKAIEEKVAKRLGITVTQAARGIIDMINVNMANGIREATINRGFDPREFPIISAGGAGPLHAATIAQELGCSLVIIPKASSIFCAAGMLMSDLRHDFVLVNRTLTKNITVEEIHGILNDLRKKGIETLIAEGLREDEIKFHYHFDMMYAGQYYEVGVGFTEEEIERLSVGMIEDKFHALHDQLYGYNTKSMPVEIVNFNMAAIGITLKPNVQDCGYTGAGTDHAQTGRRPASLGENAEIIDVPVFDGDLLTHGNEITGPAIIEQVVTTIIVPEEFNCIVDKNNNYVMYKKEMAYEEAKRFVKKPQEETV